MSTAVVSTSRSAHTAVLAACATLALTGCSGSQEGETATWTLQDPATVSPKHPARPTNPQIAKQVEARSGVSST